jgi:hypothetical protein
MDPALGRIGADTARAVADLSAIVAGLSETQLAWSPAPSALSLAQCLDHITIACERYAARLGPLIGSAPRPALPPPGYRPSLIGRRLIAAAHNSTHRLTNLYLLDPDPHPRALRALARLGGLAIAADGVNLNRPLIPLSIGDTLSLAIAHATRHVAQARLVRDHPAFPI